MKQWYDYDITELNESMFDETCETCENGFSDDDAGDAPDTTMDDTDVDAFGAEGSEDDNSGFTESDMEDGIINSDWYDNKVEPGTIPQNKTEDSAYKNDPAKFDTMQFSKKDTSGTEDVEMESFFDDVDYDLF